MDLMQSNHLREEYTDKKGNLSYQLNQINRETLIVRHKISINQRIINVLKTKIRIFNNLIPQRKRKLILLQKELDTSEIELKETTKLKEVIKKNKEILTELNSKISSLKEIRPKLDDNSSHLKNLIRVQKDEILQKEAYLSRLETDEMKIKSEMVNIHDEYKKLELNLVKINNKADQKVLDNKIKNGFLSDFRSKLQVLKELIAS